MILHAGINGAQFRYPVEGLLSPEAEIARLLAWFVLVAGIAALFGWRRLTRKPIPGTATVGAAARYRTRRPPAPPVVAD